MVRFLKCNKPAKMKAMTLKHILYSTDLDLRLARADHEIRKSTNQNALIFRHWKKNYFDINQLPYYAYLYKKESTVGTFAVCEPPQVLLKAFQSRVLTQCDQIGRFYNFSATNCLIKSSPNICVTFGAIFNNVTFV